MKKVFSLFLIFLAFFAFPSATAEAKSEESGKICLIRVFNGQKNSFVYLFPVQSNEFENVGVNKLEVEGFKFYLKSQIATIAKNYQEKIKDIDDASVSMVKFYENYDAVGFEIVFQTLASYQEFFGDKSDNENGDEKKEKEESGLFVKKTTHKTQFPFQKNVVETLNTLYSVTVQAWAETFNIDIQKENYLLDVFSRNSYCYEIVSPYKLIRSENMEEKDGVYYNIFNMTQKEIEENGEIVFWTQEINYGWWYFFALLFTLIFTMIFLLFDKWKRKGKIKEKNI